MIVLSRRSLFLSLIYPVKQKVSQPFFVNFIDEKGFKSIVEISNTNNLKKKMDAISEIERILGVKLSTKLYGDLYDANQKNTY